MTIQREEIRPVRKTNLLEKVGALAKGLLTTAQSVSPIDAAAVGSSLVAFIVVYFALFGAGTFYILRLMNKRVAAGADQALLDRIARHGAHCHRRPIGRRLQRQDDQSGSRPRRSGSSR